MCLTAPLDVCRPGPSGLACIMALGHFSVVRYNAIASCLLLQAHTAGSVAWPQLLCCWHVSGGSIFITSGSLALEMYAVPEQLRCELT